MCSSSNNGGDMEYAERLVTLQHVWWKRILRVQAPYRWNLRRLNPGFTLEVGSGIGRNLKNLNGNGVGIEPNEHAVRVARGNGLVAYTPDQFIASEHARPRAFDSLLLSHVIEHVSEDVASYLLTQYVEFVKPNGQLIIETPQEVGYRSDPTHVRFVDFEGIEMLCSSCHASVERKFSFPLPRIFGRLFVYNEFVVTARLPR